MKTVLIVSLLSAFIVSISFFTGFTSGYNQGIQVGESNAMLKAAGKCFKHIELRGRR